jgi:hypothetical protein
MSITKEEALRAGEEAYNNVFRGAAGRPALGLWKQAFCCGVEWSQSAPVDFVAGELQDSRVMCAVGYTELADVLSRAFHQAAGGKGKERHQVGGEPFTEQVMQDMARRFGVGALLGQAFKKSEESQRLPHERAVNELLGAINYLAGAVIALEAARKPANDNMQKPFGYTEYFPGRG